MSEAANNPRRRTRSVGGRSAEPARQASLRVHNLGLVLTEIAHSAMPPSRADLAQRTGLTRTTASALADQLIAGGLVEELALVRSLKAGRPAAPLAPAARTIIAAGLEVNVDYLGVRLVDLTGEVLAEDVIDGDFRCSETGVVLDELAACYRRLVAGPDLSGLPVAGLCVALPGLVDAGAGPLRVAPNLGWNDVDVVAGLARALALPPDQLTLANEANLAGQAEAAALRPDHIDSFLYVSGEVGIGGAIVEHGGIAAGRHGWSGEIGHTLVDSSGPKCGCGATGCLEQYAGKDALLGRAGLPLQLPIEALAERAADGDAAAVRALDGAGVALGVALANAINLLDVDTVVLGGIYAPISEYLIPGIERQLQLRVLWQPWAAVQVRRAQVSARAALTGAALSVLDGVLADPSAWLARKR